MKKMTLLALLFISACASSQPAEQPADVEAFIKVADDCQYLAGEWDSSLPEQRKREIEQESKDTCGKATSQQKVLKEKYKNEPKMLDLINQYDF